MPLSERQQPEEFSKSKLKREALALQELGKTLVELTKDKLAEIPLPANLLEAVQLARSLKAREARRRQLLYIGKILRNTDVEPIATAVSKINLQKRIAVSEFKQIEKWRDELIEEGDNALQKFLALYPETDRQPLRQLIRNASEEKDKNVNKGGSTALFRYLQALLIRSR